MFSKSAVYRQKRTSIWEAAFLGAQRVKWCFVKDRQRPTWWSQGSVLYQEQAKEGPVPETRVPSRGEKSACRLALSGTMEAEEGERWLGPGRSLDPLEGTGFLRELLGQAAEAQRDVVYAQQRVAQMRLNAQSCNVTRRLDLMGLKECLQLGAKL